MEGRLWEGAIVIDGGIIFLAHKLITVGNKSGT